MLVVLTELFFSLRKIHAAPNYSYGILSGFGCQERFRAGFRAGPALKFLVMLVVTVLFLQATLVVLAHCSGAMACPGRAIGICGTVCVTIDYGRSTRIP